MDTSTYVAVAAAIGAALLFAYTNGFHDAANAIATSVSTRALKPRPALAMAAIGNFIGAHLGAKVATTVAEGLVELPEGMNACYRAAGVLGAITWNFITWWFGWPTSSSHSLFGGIVGADPARRRRRAVGRPAHQGPAADAHLAGGRLRASASRS